MGITVSIEATMPSGLGGNMKNYINLRLAFACGASAIALAAASPSGAQETGFTIEELVVTA